MIWWATVDFNILVEMLLPTFLRKNKMLALLRAFVKPLDNIYKDTLYKMQHTCQVIYLEKVLNEWFNVPNYSALNHENSKKIYIEDAPKPPTKYIYLQQELPPNNYLYLGTQYLTGETIWNDFIIFIPSSYTIDMPKLTALVNYYKLAGKKYTIEFY